MKKSLRILALVLCIGLIFTAFCGCVDLDELRSKQGFINEDGTVTLNGKTYYPVEYTDLSLIFSTGYEYDPVYLTEPDVPVLLASDYGRYFDHNQDYTVLSDGSVLFCTEEVKEQVSSIVNGGYKAAGYMFNYLNSETYTEETYKLTEVENATIDSIIKTAKPEKFPEGASLYFEEQSIALYSYEENNIFKRNDFDLGALNGKCYLIDYTNSITYAVPDSLQDAVSGMLDRYIKMVFE